MKIPEHGLKRFLVVGLAGFSVSACGLPPAVTIASYAMDSILMLTGGKSSTDHAISFVAEQDCAMWRVIKGEAICKPVLEDPLEGGEQILIADLEATEADRVQNYSNPIFPPSHSYASPGSTAGKPLQAESPTQLESVGFLAQARPLDRLPDSTSAPVAAPVELAGRENKQAEISVEAGAAAMQFWADSMAASENIASESVPVSSPLFERSSRKVLQSRIKALPPTSGEQHDRLSSTAQSDRSPAPGIDFVAWRPHQPTIHPPTFSKYNHHINLCIGSFREVARAERLQRHFKEQHARIVHTLLNGEVWYRVLLPPAPGESAAAFASRFAEETGFSGWLTPVGGQAG